MEKNFEQPVAIKFYAKFGFTAAEKFETVKAVYGELAVSHVTLQHWHCRFKEGRESFKDEERSSRPLTTTMDANVTRVAAVEKEDH